MEVLQTVLTFLGDNAGLLSTGVPGVLALAWLVLQKVAPLTKTTVDDEVVAALRETVARLGKRVAASEAKAAKMAAVMSEKSE